jgi:archaeosine synthase
MVRTADALEGLGVLGTAQAGPMTLPVPSLLVPRSRTLPAAGPSLPYSTRPGAPGRRCYDLGEPAWAIELVVPTPDVGTQVGGPVQRDGRAAFVRGPIDVEAQAELARDRPDLIVLTNARTLWMEGEPFVQAVGAIRRAAGARPLLWAPRTATPNRIPFLLYSGVDLLDPIEALTDRVDGKVADPNLGFVPQAASEPALQGAGPVDRPAAEEQAVVELMGQELARARSALRAGQLRQLVETRLPSEPVLAELLRYADRDWSDLLDERAPVNETEVRPYVLREAFRRPSVRRYRARFHERYQPPPSKRILLLVPCSKTKPYRNSRSHRRIAGALEGLTALERIHVVSVTSPLGIVPRELEDLPPAKHYDIPVTGDWDADERAAVVDGVRAILARGAYEAVVVHLDAEEYAFLREAAAPGPPARWTVVDRSATSGESLAALRAALEQLTAAWPRSTGAMRVVREELRSLAQVQFGAPGANALFEEPVRLFGRPWFQRLADETRHELATLREERGLFQLTAAGGRRIGPGAGLTVEVAAGVPLTGDLFCPGVEHADRGIRAGDAVVLYRKGTLLGVGEAELPGALMTELGRGKAVHVRHRSHDAGPSEAPLAQTEVAPPGPVV